MAQTVDVEVARDQVTSEATSVLGVDEAADRDHPREAVSSRHPGKPSTRWQYQKGCRCPGCTEENTRYVSEARRRQNRPDRLELAALVPPGRVRSHLRDLLDAGMSRREISRQALVSDAVIRNILDGQARIHPRVAAALLDVLPPRATRHDDPTTGIPTGVDPLYVLRLLHDPESMAWKQDGECRRLDLTEDERLRVWFPGQGGDTDLGKQVCKGGRDLGGGMFSSPCAVKGECLAFALEHDEHGIWGGTHYSEREAMREQRA